jgi:hypothetical protein
MSHSKVRRCHITCRIESMEVLKDVTTCGQFIASNGKSFAIHSMTAAYNLNTKDTRIYAEFERMGENVVEDNMCKMGAGSIVIDSFPSDGWEAASATALKSVIECGEGPGFTLIRNGREPMAGNQAELGVSGGGEASDDDEHEPHTRPSGLDRGEGKRQRMDGMPGGGPDFVSSGSLEAMMEVERAETDEKIQELRRELEALGAKYRVKVVD